MGFICGKVDVAGLFWQMVSCFNNLKVKKLKAKSTWKYPNTYENTCNAYFSYKRDQEQQLVSYL